MQMAKLAFLGLGQMGVPMASNLLAAGHELTVWNRTYEKTEPLRAEGAAVAATPAEAASGAEAVLTMLTDPVALEAVVFGEDGVSKGIRPGTALIDLSTVGPGPIRELAARMPEGVDVLDAPVRGSVDRARAGELGVLVGGSVEAFDRWREMLRALGDPIHVGELGMGQVAKIVNNVAVISGIALVGECVALGARLGLERTAALDLLEGTTLGEAVRYVRLRMEPGDFRPRFKASLAGKDLRLGIQAGAGGSELRTVAAALSWYEDAEALGVGELDFTVVAAVAGGERPPTEDAG
jgi:3-hydroxyisobutyrate dehydrogenase-like beta-hydroxyacid dehydrogenase